MLLAVTLPLGGLIPGLARGGRRSLIVATAWAVGGIVLPGAGLAQAIQLVRTGPGTPGVVSGTIAELGLGSLALFATLRALVRRPGPASGPRPPPP